MKKICLALSVLLLAMLHFPAAAEEKLKSEALQTIFLKYPDAVLEDYLEIAGTPDGDYLIASICEEGMRSLLMFSYEDDTLQRISSSGALPQGDGTVRERLSPLRR